MSDQSTLGEYGVSDTGETAERDPVDDRLYRDEGWLREQYHGLQKSQSEVAELADVTAATIMSWMKEHDIERRSMAEAKTNADITPLKDSEWLDEQYWAQGKTLAEIGDEVGVTDHAVRNWMDRHSIETRSNSEAQTDGDVELYTDATWLRQQYWDEEKTLAEIGELAGVTESPIRRWMNKHDIGTRSTAEAMTEGDLEPLRDSDWLQKQYHERGRTAMEIGNELGVSDVTVLSRMRKHGVERRDTHSSEVQSDGNVDPLKDSEWLKTQYVDKGLNAGEIAEKLGVSKTPVLRHMKEHGIKARSIAERNSDGDVAPLRDADWVHEHYVEKELSQREIADKLGISGRTVANWMEEHEIDSRPAFERNSKGDIRPLRDEGWLREQYLQQGKTTIEIAEKLGVTTHPVQDYLTEYGIEMRSNVFDPDHLSHHVRSTWELAVANLLRDAGVDYEYESLTIEYGDDRAYTPDFVTDEYVIEVKGRIYSNEVEKAEAAIDSLDEKQYVVVGTELPADIHIRLEERAALHKLFE